MGTFIKLNPYPIEFQNLFKLTSSPQCRVLMAQILGNGGGFKSMLDPRI
jgi:hypothetical protein